MLILHHANRHERLFDALHRAMDEPPGAPFEPEHVVVPNAALQRHLTLQIADRRGVCAGIEWHFLAGFLWRQLAALRPGTPAAWPFDAGALAWRVHARLVEPGFVAPHPRLAGYLEHGDALMAWELAVNVAGLFESYVTARPEGLVAWMQGGTFDRGAAHPDEAWQAALWRAVAAGTGMQDGHPGLELLRLVQAGALQPAPGRIPARVHVVALPSAPPLALDLLRALARWMTVHVYVLNPCEGYWHDLIDRRRFSHLAARGRADHHEVGHPQLAAWGKPVQAMLERLLASDDEHVTDLATFEPPSAGHLLARWQRGVLELEPLRERSIVPAAGDRSLELHVCHSMVRQLEVLHDRLLGLFADDPTLRPCDIAVVMPDLAGAAPLIDAVFGTAPPSRALPYVITGRARTERNPVARVLRLWLALADTRHAAPAVVELLQQPPVAAHLRLDDGQALAQVHAWLREAGAHWGLDARHRAAFGAPAVDTHTLADALERLWLGHALPDDADEPWHGRLPAGRAEGQRADVLAALAEAVRTLARLQQAAAAALDAEGWRRVFDDVLASLVGGVPSADSPRERLPPATLEALREVRPLLAELHRRMVEAASPPVPLAVVRHALLALLDDPARGGVPSGAITFSALGALRQVPFRVIAALGLDDGVFPAPQRPVEFDLVAARPRRGDRLKRDEDRHLFLDLLLAARDVLHLSHSGRSVRDNAPRPASVLVQELLESVAPALVVDPADVAPDARGHAPADAAEAARRWLVVEHPLQPFSAAAFDPARPRLQSHRAEQADALRQRVPGLPVSPVAPLGPAGPGADAGDDTPDDGGVEDDDTAAADTVAAPFFEQPLSPPDGDVRAITLAELVRFFRHPARALLERRLRIRPADVDEPIDDDEPACADRRALQALARRLMPRLVPALRSSVRAGVGPAQAESPHVGPEPAEPLDAGPFDADVSDTEALAAWARAGLELPPGAVGALQFERELPTLRGHAERLRQALRGPLLPPRAGTLRLDVDGQRWQLHVAFDDLRATGRVRWRYARTGAIDRLVAGIEHLALCALAPDGVALRTLHLGLDAEVTYAEPPSPGHAAQALAELLRWRLQGLCAPLKFFPRTSWVWFESGGNPTAVRRAWAGSGKAEALPGESQDETLALAWRGAPDPLDGEFERLSAGVWGPIAACDPTSKHRAGAPAAEAAS